MDANAEKIINWWLLELSLVDRVVLTQYYFAGQSCNALTGSQIEQIYNIEHGK